MRKHDHYIVRTLLATNDETIIKNTILEFKQQLTSGHDAIVKNMVGEKAYNLLKLLPDEKEPV
jgi:hypothetical protein